jgi:hypothetical protein
MTRLVNFSCGALVRSCAIEGKKISSSVLCAETLIKRRVGGGLQKPDWTAEQEGARFTNGKKYENLKIVLPLKDVSPLHVSVVLLS